MDYTVLVPDEVWVWIAGTLSEAVDRRAFAVTSKAFATFEKLSREEVVLNSSCWAQESLASHTQLEGTGNFQLEKFVAQFPCMRTLRLLSPGVDQEDAKIFAEGVGRYVCPGLASWEYLTSYEPATASWLSRDGGLLRFKTRAGDAISISVTRDESLNIDDNFLKTLADECTLLEHLEVRHNRHISSEGLRPLAGLRCLHTLQLVGCQCKSSRAAPNHLLLPSPLVIYSKSRPVYAVQPLVLQTTHVGHNATMF
jgi:hypothetical protein